MEQNKLDTVKVTKNLSEIYYIIKGSSTGYVEILTTFAHTFMKFYKAEEHENRESRSRR